MDNFYWYIVHVVSNSENRIALEIRSKALKNNLDEMIEQIFVPKKNVITIKNGVKKESEVCLIPGYIFVKILNTQEVISFIRNLQGVIGFLGKDYNNPKPITENDIHNMIHREEEMAVISSNTIVFEVGEVVKITDGLFASMNGTIEEINEEKSRLKISINILGRTTPVDLDFSQVEKVC